MSYSIETRTVTEFVTDNTIKLPRFQRKATWKLSQNFELAISMFKEYPLGVIVINDEQGTSWLLDGRQRRSALKSLRDNPDLVYDAAKSYIKFKPNESEDDLKTKFWQKVDAYLVSYASMSDEEKKKIEENSEEEEVTEEFGIDRMRQQEGLKILLEIILMVHQKKKDKLSGQVYGKWERLFKLEEYLLNLPYALKKDNYRINPEQLHAFILSIGQKAKDENAQLTANYFLDYLEERIKDGKEQEFKSYVDQKWDDIKKIIDVVVASEVIFRRARIGVISIKNVTPLDAQNIFSRINSGGTPLTPEELISAKPFWNEPIYTTNKEITSLVKNMYQRLDISIPEEGHMVRWDLVATIMGRIKDNKLLFDSYGIDVANENKSQSFPEISLGFRLIAARFMGGVSKLHINSLEQNKEIKWPQDIDDFVEDFNRMCSAILNDDFFKSLNLWQRPLIRLIGASATFDFCAISFENWKNLGEPVHPGATLNQFHRETRALFDNLVFEYATGFWRGSGDSKMSRHLKQPFERLKPMDPSNWESLITELCTSGSYNGQPVSKANIEPLIYYQMVINGLNYPYNTKFEVDHILPQAILKAHLGVDKWFMDSAVNLTLLPKDDNGAKRDRLLREFEGTPLAHTVSQFVGIDQNDFSKFSNVSSYKEFIEKRKSLLLNTFCDKRMNVLNG